MCNSEKEEGRDSYLHLICKMLCVVNLQVIRMDVVKIK